MNVATKAVKEKPIAIIDTNVWIDAFGIGKTSPEKSLLARNVIARLMTNCTIISSRLAENELLRVLRRIEQKMDTPEAQFKVRKNGQKLIDLFLKNVKRIDYDEREFIKTHKGLPPRNNFPDQVFFALAQKESAHLVVSFDHHVTDIKSYNGTEVMSPYTAIKLSKKDFEYFLDADRKADDMLCR